MHSLSWSTIWYEYARVKLLVLPLLHVRTALYQNFIYARLYKYVVSQYVMLTLSLVCVPSRSSKFAAWTHFLAGLFTTFLDRRVEISQILSPSRSVSRSCRRGISEMSPATALHFLKSLRLWSVHFQGVVNYKKPKTF